MLYNLSFISGTIRSIRDPEDRAVAWRSFTQSLQDADGDFNPIEFARDCGVRHDDNLDHPV